MDADVIIIGAGIGGLATAALLANAGCSVIVVEKSKRIGGRAACFEKDGFVLDNGIHLSRFALKGKCAEVLREIGITPKFSKFKKILVFQNGKLFPFPKGPISYFRSPFISKNTKIQSLRYLFSVWFKKPSDYENKSVLEALSGYELEENFLDLTRIFLSSSIACPYIEKASIEEVRRFFLHGMKSPFFPVGYLKGGWKKALVLLQSKVLENGKILLGVKVKRLVIENETVKFVETTKGSFSAKCYVSSIPAQDLKSIIELNKLSPEIKNYSKIVEKSCGFSIYMGLSKKFLSLPSSVISKNTHSINGTMILSANPPSMGTIISTIEKRVAPKGKNLLVWFSFVPLEKINDKSFINNQINEVKLVIDNSLRLCFNNQKFNISEFCEWEKVIIHKMVDGAIPKVGQGIKERLDFKCNIKNLFFAGDTTRGDGWGGDIAFDSALKCSKLVKAMLRKGK